jgi:Tfp pilus assembly protein PilF
MLHANQEAWRDAAIWYERALDRDPKHLLSHFNMALAAERMGKPRMAAEHYRAFLGDTPTTAVYETLRARAREAMTRLGEHG